MNDSRVCMGLAQTAALAGAKISNYTQVMSLINGKDGKVCGAKVKDLETGKEFEIRAKAVVNCSGPFSDQVRALGDKNAAKMIMPSAGVHITLPVRSLPSPPNGRPCLLLPAAPPIPPPARHPHSSWLARRTTTPLGTWE